MSDGNRRELKILGWLVGLFLVLYHLPVETARFQGAIIEAFKLAKWYAREHVLLCLIPAFFIAGAIGVFVSQNAVMKYLGPKASKWLSYSVASVSGTILAVCSCTVLPLFGSIYMRGAGLGPAVAFLYSGPAINVLAIVLTARLLGWQLGVARAVGAVTFSVVIGLLMHLLYRKEERAKAAKAQDLYMGEDAPGNRPLWKTALLFLVMVAVLVFANWARSGDVRAVFLCCPNGLTTLRVEGREMERTAGYVRVLTADGAVQTIPSADLVSIAPLRHPGVQDAVHAWRWAIVLGALAALALMVIRWVPGSERKEWLRGTWGFGKQITPLLMGGVLAAGFFLGSPESPDAGIVPNVWIRALVGDSPSPLLTLLGRDAGDVPGWMSAVWPVWTNFFASLTGALMYFATLTEVPILRGLLDSGMGQGPALALLLAGPALSLPSMLVINSLLGPRKTLTFIGLVVVMATITGVVFGWMAS
ncbi:MAG: hypothetical protein FJ222_05085 [Lentisphaerae bacterium]|nr:hypothetical protein [Lentisphaerota bacterium]